MTCTLNSKPWIGIKINIYFLKIPILVLGSTYEQYIN